MFARLVNRIQRLLGNETKEPLLPSVEFLGFRPKHLDYYRLAFTHRSCGEVDADGNKFDNERLEFLGDSVLSTVISTHLYRQHPEWNEGRMNNRRSAMVKRATNNAIGRQMGLERYLRFGQQCTEQLLDASDIYGNALEALVGAVYLDRGFATAERFILCKVLPIFLELEESLVEHTTNYKSLLIEWAQKYQLQIEFRMLQEPRRTGAVFVAAVYIDEKKVGVGRGRNKKEAHQEAAHNALKALNAIDPTVRLRD